MSAAILITLMQLADSYLRYLSFKNKNSPEENKQLWFRIFLWAICAVTIYEEIFDKFGAGTVPFKAAILIGWLPYFLILVVTIRRQIFQHIFIFGMSAIWVISQNNFAAIIDVLFFLDEPEEELLLIHSALCLALFVILLPAAKYFFEGLGTTDILFENPAQGKYFAALPLLLSAVHFFLWADEQLVHTWQERFSRLYLVLGFFCIYQYILSSTKTSKEYLQALREEKLLQAQLKSLEHNNNLIKENQEQIEQLQNNLHEDYEYLISLLKKSNVKAAQKFLKQQENLLNTTRIIRFCQSPLINAAISIYLQQAKRFGIKFEHKITMPPEISTDEGEFAILLSNILENAIIASQKQPKNERQISILIKYVANKCILEISNLYNEPLQLNSSGFPVTSSKDAGHGIGMLSVRTFAKKYKAQVAFQQQGNKVRFVMYWEEPRR